MKVLGRQFLWFGIAGILGLLTDLAVLHGLAGWLGWYGARVLSFLAAATVTWVVNRRVTFADRVTSSTRPSLGREYLSYLGAMLGGAALNYGVYALVLYWRHDRWAATLGVVLGSLAGMVLNFVSARQLVFRRRTPH